MVEVHDKVELEIALRNNCELIGINNRNLKTFEVSIQTSILLSKKIENKDVVIVSESGIKTKDDINLLKNNNINVFLVGESLITSENPSETLKNLVG